MLGAMQIAYYRSDKRCKRFMTPCRDVNEQELTIETDKNERLVKTRLMSVTGLR